MPEIADGQSVEVQGSGAKPYVLKNVGGVYSCSCPAWRNQSVAIERRTCKHLRKYRGDEAEEARLGGALPAKPVRAKEDDAAAREPALLLAERWDNSLNPQGWWMSEKLDGVRAFWDGRQFLSRQGNLYHAPDWFIAGLPATPLDGELWLDRKAFQRTVGIVRRQDKGEPWRTIRFVVFDAPAAGGPFEDRLQFLKDEVRRWQNPFTAVHEQMLCHDVEHLREELRRIESLGGEGIMLREPRSKYVAGRSTSLLKVKTFYDAEATVIRHEPGKGRHLGRLGALTVRLPNGKEFSVGTGFSDRHREQPPAIGSLITFRYQELSDAGIPRFPSFVGLRHDAPQPTQAAPKVEPQPETAKPAEKAANVSVSVRQPKSSEPTLIGSRYFECREGTSNKFWEVSVVGTKLTTRWGRIGSKAQSKTKTLPSSDAAWAERDSLIESKLFHGYHEIAAKPAEEEGDDAREHEDEASESLEPAEASKQSEPEQVRTKSETKVKAAATESIDAKAALASGPTMIGGRYFECGEGVSGQFYEIAVDGAALTMHWGRIGTSGKSKSTTYSSAEAASRMHNLSIQWKQDAGYWEVFAGDEADKADCGHEASKVAEPAEASKFAGDMARRRDALHRDPLDDLLSLIVGGETSGLSQETPSAAVATPKFSADPAVAKLVSKYVSEYQNDREGFTENGDPTVVPTGKIILEKSPAEQIEILKTCYAFRNKYALHSFTIEEIARSLREQLLKSRLPLTSADVDFLAGHVALVWGGLDGTLVAVIERWARDNPLSQTARENMRSRLDSAELGNDRRADEKLKVRVAAIIGDQAERNPLNATEVWRKPPSRKSTRCRPANARHGSSSWDIAHWPKADGRKPRGSKPRGD